MSIELTFVGYEGGVPKYMPVDAASQKLCEGQTVLIASPVKKGTRTNKQNNAMHLLFSRMSKVFNDAGLDMRKVFKPEAEIPWDEKGYNVKEKLWKEIQVPLTGKTKTSDLNTEEVSKVYEALNSHIASKHGVSVPFPEIYKLLYEQEGNV